IGAASRGLFGKDPDAIDPVEAVLLAALLRGPNASAEKVAVRACAVAKRLDPVPDCRDIRTRADAVLSQRYRIEPRWQDAIALARRLLREPGEQRATTLDARLQRRALQALGGTRDDTSVVVLDNLTGEVRVWGGGPDTADTVLQRQPTGSALQPFLYGMAIEQRWLTAASVLDDSPAFVTPPLPPGMPDGEPRGAVSVRSALALAADMPALRVRALIGDDALDATLQAHGLAAVSNGGARASLMNGRSADRSVWWSVGFTRHYTVALRAPRPVAATWLALIDALEGPSFERPGAPPGVERVRVQFEPAIEAARDEYFMPGTQQAFVDATVRDVSGRPRIVLPTSGVKLVSAALPAGRQTVLFEARPPLPGLVWLINGERLPAVEGRALWSPRPGRHRLALLDAAGLQVESIAFEVRLDDAAPPSSAP
ncbi:MAG: penicillin-binding protein, partial [Methyloversatilis sp. 12-65-5]